MLAVARPADGTPHGARTAPTLPEGPPGDRARDPPGRGTGPPRAPAQGSPPEPRSGRPARGRPSNQGAPGRRAVRVYRVTAKRIFTPTRIPGARFVVNQYVGCEHACSYCYARFTCRWRRDRGPWGTWVEAKVNAPDLVRGRPVRGRVVMSSVSDAYQPVERELELTRRVLEAMDRAVELSILTKSDLVLRDVDLLSEFPRLEVGLTVNGLEGRAARLLEPLAPGHGRRVEALEGLRAAGLRTFAFVSPVIPGLVDPAAVMEEVAPLVDFFYVEFINARAAGSGFRRILTREFPESAEVVYDGFRFREYVRRTAAEVRGTGLMVREVVTHLRGRRGGGRQTSLPLG